MKNTTDKTKQTEAALIKEVKALVQALKKSGTRAGTGDQMDEIRKAKR